VPDPVLEPVFAVLESGEVRHSMPAADAAQKIADAIDNGLTVDAAVAVVLREMKRLSRLVR